MSISHKITATESIRKACNYVSMLVLAVSFLLNLDSRFSEIKYFLLNHNIFIWGIVTIFKFYYSLEIKLSGLNISYKFKIFKAKISQWRNKITLDD